MFKSLKSYKKLEWHLSDTQKALSDTQKALEAQKEDRQILRKQNIELSEHNTTAESTITGLKQQILALESDTKEYQEIIQHKDNELEGLRNVANARLSALVGMKRYLDRFFDDGSTTAPVTQQEKATTRQATPNFKNPKQTPDEWNIKPYPFDDTPE